MTTASAVRPSYRDRVHVKRARIAERAGQWFWSCGRCPEVVGGFEFSQVDATRVAMTHAEEVHGFHTHETCRHPDCRVSLCMVTGEEEPCHLAAVACPHFEPVCPDHGLAAYAEGGCPDCLLDTL